MIMASPLLSSFCCEFHCNVAENASCHLQMPRWELLFRDGTMSYNILCILSSVFGVIGAVYQLRLRLHDLFGYSARMPEAINRQSRIIFWLAAADGFASLGIVIGVSIQTFRFLIKVEEQSDYRIAYNPVHKTCGDWLFFFSLSSVCFLIFDS